MTIKTGWEVSSDREKQFEDLMANNPIGNPIITSKCIFDGKKGFLVLGDNGFAWKVKIGVGSTLLDVGKKKWVRWYDVADILSKKKGEVEVLAYERMKTGDIKLDTGAFSSTKGELKTKKLKLKLMKNKKEPKDQWKEREESFHSVLMEIFSKYKVESPPAESDSKY